MKIQPEDLTKYEIPVILRYGRMGFVEGIDPQFFDTLTDYIESNILDELTRMGEKEVT